MQERLRELRHAWDAYLQALGRRDMHSLVSLFDKELSGFGTAADEISRDYGTSCALYARDCEQVPQPLSFMPRWVDARLLGEDAGVVAGMIDASGKLPEGELYIEGLRLSAVFRRLGGSWLLAHMHLSLPAGDLAEGESYPLAELQERNRELEERVARRTGELQRETAAKDQLLRELHHRTKNSLQLIISLLRLQLGPEAAQPASLDEVIAQVRAMGMVHEQLYHSKDLARIDFADYLKDLVGETGMRLRMPSPRLTIEPSAIGLTLPVSQAVTVGLIVNALLAAIGRAAADAGGDATSAGTVIVLGREGAAARLECRGCRGAAVSGSAWELLPLLVEQLGGTLAPGVAPGTDWVLLIPPEG